MTHAVPTVTAASTPIEAWQICGIKHRVLIVPPCAGGDIRHILGTTFWATSPRFMASPICSRMDSIRALILSAALSSSRVSVPVAPTSSARSKTTGMPLSIQVIFTLSTSSITFPVGNRVPQADPAVFRKSIMIGADVPGVPSMRASPSYETMPRGVWIWTSQRFPELTM